MPSTIKSLTERYITGRTCNFRKAGFGFIEGRETFLYPGFTKQCDYETELVIRICRLGKNIAPRFAYRYYDAVTVGIDFTARDLQRKFRREGLPWELCKGFDSSAAIGDFVSKGRASGYPADTFSSGYRRAYGAGMIFGRYALRGR